ncbi:phenylalanine--tRNA ligase subunit alpha [Candidatus Anaplasma sp. TIGMIC]|uniref:phenylalanine--tRNA ligase subunit alpha n=1 Tax=Candidatus Anaplasma sp. TIGMIC TaxID=3020713 RepID=UPI00232B4842|nr:phenylalanine--tRNA ligase subunit alpha [Candidatus Anaplasma sp. TIGMIC]MDB1135788.1 phenylalanine--tRNA ligase subunit alpha [Candidatus Anaplasma sp. TIGMIC]
MLKQIRELAQDAQLTIAACSSLESLDEVRARYLGRSGSITSLMKLIPSVEDLSERKAIGAEANAVCSEIKLLLSKRIEQFELALLEAKLKADAVDITLPSRRRPYGLLHPITKVMSEMQDILVGLGFVAVHGPDLEDEYHVFDALNTPVQHPARTLNDTFYMKKRLGDKRVVLRTHTSSVQVRTMERCKDFPIKVISCGKVYRNDWDATHSPMFHQVEGLYIDKNVSMGHLKYVINHFLRAYFGPTVETRMRASFFPFTEPSAEVDVKNSDGQWVEVLGCGMVHQKVLQNANVDTSQYRGFAFGMGVERMAMLKYDMPDLRDLYKNKLEWLDHYGFCFTDLVS